MAGPNWEHQQANGQQWGGYNNAPPNYPPPGYAPPPGYLNPNCVAPPAPSFAPPAAPVAQIDPADQARIDLIKKIWGNATGMLVICLVFAGELRGGAGFVAAAIVLGAAATTAVLRPFGGRPVTRVMQMPDEAAAQKIRELEERLANLETITNFEEKLLDSKLRKLGVDAVPLEVQPRSQPVSAAAETATSPQQPVAQ